MEIEKIIKAAKGEEIADIVIKNANIINVLSGDIHRGDVAVVNGKIVGIGKDYKGREEIDINGSYLSPSFIDGHVHLESSMVSPYEYAKAVIPSGTTTVVADPHEISNVLGLQGISFNQTKRFIICMVWLLVVYQFCFTNINVYMYISSDKTYGYTF